MKITELSVAIVRGANEPADDRDQCAVIAVTAEDGTTGYGEANANPAAVKALLETDFGLTHDWDHAPRRVLLGADATDPSGSWRQLTEHSFWSCRAGIGYVALAGVDMALWDLAGKLAGRPSWQLLGERRNPHPVAYVTLYHGPGPFDRTVGAMLDALDAALAMGYRAVKVEPLPECAPESADIVSLARYARERAGDNVTLLVDVGYRWSDHEEAISVARQLDGLGIFALEAPFAPHDVAAYRALASAVRTPISSGDQLTAPVEYLPMLDSGAVAILQGGAARTGISGMNSLARWTKERGCRFVPWGWVATTVAVAANLHLSLVHDNVPLIEYAPPQLYPKAPIRNDLFGPEPAVSAGEFVVPEAPGLGVAIDERALVRLRVDR